MSELERIDFGNSEPGTQNAAAPHSRVVGSPLSKGPGSRPSPPPRPAEAGRPAPPPGRTLPGEAPASAEESSGLQRAINAVRSALPFVQRILPLLDGNLATTVGSLITQQPHPAPPPPKVDLVPIEDGLAELETRHRELREQVMEQNTSLKRVEDQLEMVREATDRNTLEQQELLEDLKTFGNKVKIAILIVLGVVAVGFALNLILYLHIQRVLP